jgi:hypothetical protein
MKILKKGGVVEKRGEEETKSMPHAPVFLTRNFKFEIALHFSAISLLNMNS